MKKINIITLIGLLLLTAFVAYDTNANRIDREWYITHEQWQWDIHQQVVIDLNDLDYRISQLENFTKVGNFKLPIVD